MEGKFSSKPEKTPASGGLFEGNTIKKKRENREKIGFNRKKTFLRRT